MYRKAIKYLETWYKGSVRKPLILWGARQVGKSTLVRLFAQTMELDLHEVNLERHLYLNTVFASNNTANILSEIQGITGHIRDNEKTLLFLDEIQAVPEAIPALRYLHEDHPDIAVVAAGSLLEFALADHNFSMPVGRISYFYVGPLSFDEYLQARDPDLHRFYSEYEWGTYLPQSRHESLLLRQREFLVVGGMPEAAQAFIKSESFADAQDAQRNIADTYIDDFAKYARKTALVRLQRVFRAIPLIAGKKVKYVSISRDDKAAETRAAIDLLNKAGVCVKVFNTSCAGLPLGACRDDNCYKLISVDSGLMTHQLGLSWPQVNRLTERSLINEGALAEQFVGQELLALRNGMRTPELYYWLREGRSDNAEVDYVIDADSRIIPIEVKAGKSGTLKSIRQFMLSRQSSLAVRFDLNTPSTQIVSSEGITFTLLSLPLYMVGKLLEILNRM